MHSLRPLLLIFAAGVIIPRSLLAGPDPQQEALWRSVNAFWTHEVSTLGGKHYQPPKLRLFATPVEHGCGSQAALSGPFYCPADGTVYLDQRYLQQLRRHDRPEATLLLGLVMAHELGHHLQSVLGITANVEQALSSSNADLSRRTYATFELQADCYAGLWARQAAAQGTVHIPADLALPLGDLAVTSQAWQSQLSADGQMPDPLSTGSAAQRLKWFRRGLDSGKFSDCDTFAAEAGGTL
ncbi:MAG TPA: neutral zinc metallopeptidase [Dyella sp.]|uniref:neutral zinc metallopeptidase n=1 Tax=Dyella sp. TaxID=1869338 RepID=UPI002D7894B1|nr:neutral zinc metallopeptidase [Dyella sp.]HET6554671.1 neutral zinc metallopeptidase [Dyella sp.]